MGILSRQNLGLQGPLHQVRAWKKVENISPHLQHRRTTAPEGMRVGKAETPLIGSTLSETPLSRVSGAKRWMDELILLGFMSIFKLISYDQSSDKA